MVKVLPKTKKRNRPYNILIPFSLQNRSLAYRKLPQQQLLKLSVLKLDGSSFSFHVARNATVARLKLAIEEEFSLFPDDEREKLWSLVWSHFCLSYEGKRLIRDTACIQKYGIKDGDQLHFIQHLRIDLAPSAQDIESKQCSVTSPPDARANHPPATIEDQYPKHKYLRFGEEYAFPERRSSLTHSLKEFLSCSKFQQSKRDTSE